MKYNRNSLKKLETIYNAQGYQVRYEKGSFSSGHCMVRADRIVVINKFFDLEGRITKLIELLDAIEMDPERLDANQLKLLRKLNVGTEQEETGR